MDDDELFAIARESIGARFELSPAQSARLRGTTRKELEAEARAMRRELQLPDLDEGAEHDERRRDERGRFASGEPSGASMNVLIRRAAGR
jgi:hypothetical protein